MVRLKWEIDPDLSEALELRQAKSCSCAIRLSSTGAPSSMRF